MKKIFLFFGVSCCLNMLKAQVNVKDFLALTGLYNSTNGHHCKHNDG